jgi:hypothetical protein
MTDRSDLVLERRVCDFMTVTVCELFVYHQDNMCLSKSLVSIYCILSSVGLASGISNTTFSANATSTPPKSTTPTTFESSEITHPDSVALRPSWISSGSTRWDQNFISSSAVGPLSTRTESAPCTVSHISTGTTNATYSNSSKVETQPSHASANDLSVFQNGKTDLPYLNGTTAEGVHGAPNTTVTSRMEAITTTWSTTTILNSRSSNITHTSFDSWSQCVKPTYATDFPVALRSLSPECDTGPTIDDLQIDDWFRYDYVDRCLARYCWTSWVSAVGAYTGPLTESYPYPYTYMNISSTLVTRSVLTASDEYSLFWSYSYGPLESTTLMSTYIITPWLR